MSISFTYAFLYSYIFSTIFPDNASALFSTELSLVFPVGCKYSRLFHGYYPCLLPPWPCCCSYLWLSLFLYVALISLRADNLIYLFIFISPTTSIGRDLPHGDIILYFFKDIISLSFCLHSFWRKALKKSYFFSLLYIISLSLSLNLIIACIDIIVFVYVLFKFCWYFGSVGASFHQIWKTFGCYFFKCVFCLCCYISAWYFPIVYCGSVVLISPCALF